MGRAIGKLVGGVTLVLAVIGIVVVLGMRTRSPRVLNAVRRTNRTVRPLALRSAGAPGGNASVIRHTGRTTGRQYATPVEAIATDDGFVIALVYGPNTDWLKNVRASGSASIDHEGRAYAVDRPEVVPLAEAALAFPPRDQRAHRLFGVEQCLRMRRVAPDRAGPVDDAP